MTRTIMWKLKSIGYMTLGGAFVFAGLNIYNENSKFYNKFVMPMAHYLGPEKAHRAAILVNKYRLLPKTKYKDPETLKTTFLNMELSNPIGIAAGFDKHAEAIKGLSSIGFGFVEIGSVTPLPQEGNPQPRVFRLPEDKAIINRYGFNSDGHNKVLKRLHDLRQSNYDGVIGVNLGKNKTSIDPIQDYESGITTFGPVADYLVINISSPNTPGLRQMQSKETLKVLLPALIKARNELPIEKKPPLLLKLAPDLTFAERKEIADVIKIKSCQIDGLIISNTTTVRDEYLKNIEFKNETGGLSGQPLADMSTRMIREMYILTDGQIPIIGAGGVFNGQDAYEKIKAGASLIQIYTSFIYHGPPVIAKIKSELNQCLIKDGYTSLDQAVGKNVQLNNSKLKIVLAR